MNPFSTANEIVADTYNCVIEQIEDGIVSLRIYNLDGIVVMHASVKKSALLKDTIIMTVETGKEPIYREAVETDLKENLILKWEIGHDPDIHTQEDEGFVRFTATQKILTPSEEAERQRKIKEQAERFSKVFSDSVQILNEQN